MGHYKKEDKGIAGEKEKGGNEQARESAVGPTPDFEMMIVSYVLVSLIAFLPNAPDRK